jgi:hypothetical protein
MGFIQIQKCDLCDKEFRSDDKNNSYSSIGEVTLTFKKHLGIQSEPFNGDMCFMCADYTRKTIKEALNHLRAPKEAEA